MNLRPPVDVFRCVFADETSQRMDAAEPLISCADRTVALFFHVRQEQADHLRGEIINGQAVDPLVDLGGQIRKLRAATGNTAALDGARRPVHCTHQPFSTCRAERQLRVARGLRFA